MEKPSKFTKKNSHFSSLSKPGLDIINSNKIMTNFNRDNAIGHTINKQVKAISTSLKDKFKSLNKNYFNCSLEDPTSEPNPSQKLAKAG